jgi:hypothetical protein
LAQCRKKAPILVCPLLKVYTGEKALGNGLQRPCHRGRVDHDRKIRSRKQRTDIEKDSSVSRTIQLWDPLPADALGTLSCKPSKFRRRIRKVIKKKGKAKELWKS